MRWQLGQRITSALRWIWLKSWGGTRMRQPWQIPPRTSTTARPPRREKIISYLRRRSPSIVCTSSERVARSRSISVERRASVSRSSLASRSRSAPSRASSAARPESFAVAPSTCSITVISSVSSVRSEEHTSELQSQFHLVCRLLLEKKKSQTGPCEKHLLENQKLLNI